MKWKVITEIKGLKLSNFKNIDQYRFKYFKLINQAQDLLITFEDTIMLKVLNNLSSEYN